MLDPSNDEQILYADLLSKGIYRKEGATLMLDQRSFAELRNYLRSEILHATGVHPDDRPCDLDDQTVKR